MCPLESKEILPFELGDNCIQICHLRTLMGGFMVENFVLRRRVYLPKWQIWMQLSPF